VVLTVDGKTYKSSIEVKNDPRSPTNPSGLHAQNELQLKVYEGDKLAWEGYEKVNAMRAAVKQAGTGTPTDEVKKALADFDTKLVAIGGAAAAGGRRGAGGFRGPGGPSPAPTFVRLVGVMTGHINALDPGDMAPSESQRKVCSASCEELKALVKKWNDLNAKDLAALNALLEKNKVATISASPIASRDR